LRSSENQQEKQIEKLAKRLHEIEDHVGHSRTILIGDLNADPFDRRIRSAMGLHAEKSRSVCLDESRRVDGEIYRYFYNPMWRFLGHQAPLAQGTYFRAKSEYDDRHWRVLDQVLLRPSLLPYFADDNVQIITDVGETSFRDSKGRPNPKIASDHFPILVKLTPSAYGGLA